MVNIYDAIIVGGGIVGTTITLALQNAGYKTLLLDSNESLGGTRASGGHLRPEWFGGMPKQEYEPAMQLLSEVWSMIEEQFLFDNKHLTTVYRVDTDKVVETSRRIRVTSKVSQLQSLEAYPRVKHEKGEDRCRLLVVAAGIWTDLLIPSIKVKGKQGASFRFKGTLDQPIIKPWAPYKQVVAHQQALGEIWVGDGSTILAKNWNNSRTSSCLQHCVEATGISSQGCKIMLGIRPYCEAPDADPCLLKKVYPRVWVATGAGKSGTIAAGWAARRILDACN